MVAMLVASILVITASTFLVGVFQNYSRNQRYVEMQRDGAAALQLLGKQLREATQARVSVTNNVVRVTGTNSVTRSFYINGRDLYFDPNVAQGGNEQRIIVNRVQSFIASNDTRSVHITLHLDEGSEESILRSQFTFRN